MGTRQLDDLYCLVPGLEVVKAKAYYYVASRGPGARGGGMVLESLVYVQKAGSGPGSLLSLRIH